MPGGVCLIGSPQGILGSPQGVLFSPPKVYFLYVTLSYRTSSPRPLLLTPCFLPFISQAPRPSPSESCHTAKRSSIVNPASSVVVAATTGTCSPFIPSALSIPPRPKLQSCENCLLMGNYSVLTIYVLTISVLTSPFFYFALHRFEGSSPFHPSTAVGVTGQRFHCDECTFNGCSWTEMFGQGKVGYTFNDREGALLSGEGPLLSDEAPQTANEIDAHKLSIDSPLICQSPILPVSPIGAAVRSPSGIAVNEKKNGSVTRRQRHKTVLRKRRAFGAKSRDHSTRLRCKTYMRACSNMVSGRYLVTPLSSHVRYIGTP